jgi:tRNA nucleotidyltransferase (CCA-adding enzyme)
MRLNNLDTFPAFEIKQFKGYLCELEYLNNYLLLVQHGKFENIHF